MWPLPLLLFGGLGVFVIFLALRKPKQPQPPPLPIAKIEDGTPIVPPQPPKLASGCAPILAGVVLILIGAFLSFIVAMSEAFSGWGSMGRPLRVRGRVRLPARARGEGGHDGAQPRLAGLGAWQRAWRGERW